MADTRAHADDTAVRVALWRALHVLADPSPPVLNDTIGLALAAPPEGWRDRPDMNVDFTRHFRATIVARARFIEDLVAERAAAGVRQYVLLGAGLDTFAQRAPELASTLHVFEVDRPSASAWKKQRLQELGYGIPDWLRLVPVDFESGASWPDEIQKAGFDRKRPAVVTSTGVTMYLTREAILAMLRQCATLAPGSTFATTFMNPIESVEPEERASREIAERGARANGTPFISCFEPEQMLALVREAGFKEARHVSAAELTARYFAGRPDGLRLYRSEEIVVATT